MGYKLYDLETKKIYVAVSAGTFNKLKTAFINYCVNDSPA